MNKLLILLLALISVNIPAMQAVDMPLQHVDDVSVFPPQTLTPVISYTMGEDYVLVTVTGDGHICVYSNDLLVDEGEEVVEFTILFGEYEQEYEIMATAQEEDMLVSEPALLHLWVPAITLPPYETPAPELYCELTDDAMIFRAVGEGIVTLYIQLIDNETGELTDLAFAGEGEAMAAIPRGYEDSYVNFWATAQASDDALIGISNVEYYIEIPAIYVPQTLCPDIYSYVTEDGVYVTASGEGYIYLYFEGILVAEGYGEATYFIPFGDEEQEVYFYAAAQEDGMEMSEYVYYSLIVPARPVYETPIPELTCTLTDYAMNFMAVGEGTVTLYIQFIDNETGEMTNETYTGQGEASACIPRGYEDTYVNVWAVAEVDGALPGETGVECFLIPAMYVPEMTETPVITWEIQDDFVEVTVTGEGCIYLYCNGELVVEGYGTATYSIPRGYDDELYEIMACAQEDGKEMSEYVLYMVVVPAQRPQTPAPEIIVEPGEEFYTIYAVADNAEVFMFSDGVQVENPYIVYLTDEEQILFIDAYAQADGYQPSVTVTYQILIPAKAPHQQGDINGDGRVSISDVSALINYLLSHNDGEYDASVDVNHDGRNSISDVTTLINYLLSGTW